MMRRLCVREALLVVACNACGIADIVRAASVSARWIVRHRSFLAPDRRDHAVDGKDSENREGAGSKHDLVV